MNLHVPRSYQTQVELEELAAVPTQVVSPQGSEPVMGPVQDSMLACFRWTLSKNLLNYRQVMHLLAWTSTYSGTLPPPDALDEKGMGLWKAQSIITTIMPKITIINTKDEDKVNRLKIVHGVFEEGVLSKQSAGSKIGNIIHAVWKDFGAETNRLFMDNLMNLTMQWLLIDGFSIGMRDTVIPDATKQAIDEKITSIYTQIVRKIADLREGKFKVKFSNISLAEHFENEMFELVNQIRDGAQSLAYNSMGEDNRMWATVTSGSKGSKANIVQIASLLGQRMLEGGKRVFGGYSNRTLPHYAKYDLRPESHGLILSNYISGLNPIEYFMDAMSGREGVISTAIKTAITGYNQRKLIKVMEDMKIQYDNTVRNANNFIVSHVYAGDSFDASLLEKETIDYFNMDPNSSKWAETYKWSESSLKEKLSPEAYAEWTVDAKTNFGFEFLEQEYQQIIEDRRVLREEMYPNQHKHGLIYSPINFRRLMEWITHSCGLLDRKTGDVSPHEVISKTNALIKDIVVSDDPYVSEVCTRHIRFLIRNYCNSKRLIVKHKFTKQALDLMLMKIKQHYLATLINPGEMIGTISAQSIGERLTQLTLDTFHQAGLGGRTKKLNEVPRLREVFSCTANPKTPFVNIHISSETLGIDPKAKEATISHAEAQHRCENILDKIQYTTLNSMIENYQIIFDPVEKNTIITEDRVWLSKAHDIMGIDPNDIDTPWLLRFEFNSEKIQNIKIRDIAIKLAELSTDDIRLNILHTPQNVAQVIMRIRVSTQGEDPKKELNDLTKQILMTSVKGLVNINGGDVINEDRDIYIDDRFISIESDEYRNKYKYIQPKGADPNAKPSTAKSDLDPRYQQYMIQTEGSNLYDILALDGIDTYKTRSNDLHETLEVLGAEAVRELIVQEIIDVFAMASMRLNNRHFELLADIMTAQGYLVSSDRYGMNKTDTGILSKATFETTTNQVANAAIFGEEDPMRGVSANIMFGQFFKGGTNSADILLDEEMIIKNAEEMYYPKKVITQKNVEFQETETLSSCQNLNFEFSL
jgi:DNA-directed RNA polymerase II subunit RPB1